MAGRTRASEDDFILLFIPGGPRRDQRSDDISHLGFALDSRAAVDEVAARASADGILEREPRDEPYPVGYYCGVRDPDGKFRRIQLWSTTRTGNQTLTVVTLPSASSAGGGVSSSHPPNHQKSESPACLARVQRRDLIP